MTNSDVIKMVGAGLDESLIITSIQNSEPKFDTSAAGVIELNQAKVPNAVISAMIKKGSGDPAPSASAPIPTPAAKAASGGTEFSPTDVILVDGDEEKVLQYSKPQVRAAARGLGFGGVASYLVLNGTKSGTVVKNRKPEFIVCLPERAQPGSLIEIVNFAVRRNNSREIMTGGGYASYSSGFPQERLVPVRFEKVADQARAPRGYTIYRAIPQRGLLPGEYAVVAGASEAGAGVLGMGPHGSCYDFTIAN